LAFKTSAILIFESAAYIKNRRIILFFNLLRSSDLNCCIQVKEKAVEDIKEYEKGMDWVMIHFHKDRMKRINEVIRELWRSIYRGNDIDYVEIKTEEGATTATGTAYNFCIIYSRISL